MIMIFVEPLYLQNVIQFKVILYFKKMLSRFDIEK